jgi:hypothetical protein
MLKDEGTILIVLGMIGGFSQTLVEWKPLIEAAFYGVSTIAVAVGLIIKLHDRFKK